ncbi:MAG: hypothetical protein WBO55_19655 [Rhizobiaceae bacterium]
MALQRLDLRTVRYDRLSGSVMIDARNCVVEVSREALEALYQRKLKPEEAVIHAVKEARRLTELACRIPADDGKIHITTNILLNDGLFGAETGS